MQVVQSQTEGVNAFGNSAFPVETCTCYKCRISSSHEVYYVYKCKKNWKLHQSVLLLNLSYKINFLIFQLIKKCVEYVSVLVAMKE